MAEHVVNFVEGGGISIQSSLSALGDAWDVEISETVVPEGGSAGQLLAKQTDADYDTGWTDPAAGGLQWEDV